MHDFTPIASLIGGVLIGLSASVFLFSHGKVAGISGLFGGILRRSTSDDRGLRISFIAGLFAAGLLVRILFPSVAHEAATTWAPAMPLALVAGLLVGFGTQLGNGCTSGHGVCGLSRLSVRSLVATLTFIGTGTITVFVMRHLFGGLAGP